MERGANSILPEAAFTRYMVVADSQGPVRER
jgi:hypothetical protein